MWSAAGPYFATFWSSSCCRSRRRLHLGGNRRDLLVHLDAMLPLRDCASIAARSPVPGYWVDARARSRRSSSAVCVSPRSAPALGRFRRIRSVNCPASRASQLGLRALLVAVVDVALRRRRSSSWSPPACRTSGVLDEPHFAEDEARLRGQVANQFSLAGFSDRSGHPDGQAPSMLAPVSHVYVVSSGGPDVASSETGTGSRVAASAGHAAAWWRWRPDRSHTRATSAPEPSPRTCAIRGRTSSVA